MRIARAGLITLVVAALLLTSAAIIVSLGGLKQISSAVGGLHPVSYRPKTFAPIEAGATPRVTINDYDSRVIISVAQDGKVHVQDASDTRGLVLGYDTLRPLRVLTTPDGVHVTRAPMQNAFHIDLGVGGDDAITDVAVPAGASVSIERCGGAELAGVTGELSVFSDDGSISAHDLRVKTGRLHTVSGSIRLALAGASNLTVTARTASGSLRVNGVRQNRSAAYYKIGTGAGSLDVSSKSGNIRITLL